MRARWLVPLGMCLAMATCVHAQTARLGAPIQPVGYLVPAATAHAPAPYQPRAGDIILCDDFNKLHHLVFWLSRTAPPTHAAMVIARPDGTPALLDLTGPTTISAKVVISDVEARFKSYPGVILVRQLREPLTPAQSANLTKFAETEAGKSFAFPRVLLQGTPFCPRYGLRKELFGKTYLTRDRWFCSELVVAGCASANILDGKNCCANATLPHDLAFDQTLDLSRLYHPPIYWSPGGR